jgi:tryptophanyl-tRNA synthetase
MNNKEEIITPWEVKSNNSIDYMKLINKFGSQSIDTALINRFERVTGVKAHTWLRRGLFFSHRDLDKVLDDYEQGKLIYLFTGRGSSTDSMHLGHMIPFMFTKYLQDAFDAIVIIQLSDTEKYYFKDGLTLDEYNRMAYENAKDIIACEFNREKTFIFSDLETVGGSLYKNAVHIMRNTTGNQIRGIYGLNLDNNIGQLVWPAFQAAPAFSNSFDTIFNQLGLNNKEQIRCLVPMAIDQDPYFRMSRDFADKFSSFGYIKPAAIHSKFLPGLNGVNSKMSSTDANSVIFMDDNIETITKKIKGCFSGGKMTLKEHRLHGGDLTIDIAYQYLLYFLDDDDELNKIANEYKSGIMTSGQIKNKLIDIISIIVKNHQSKRYLISSFDLNYYFKMYRNFDFGKRKKQIYMPVEYTAIGSEYDPYFGLYD